jgi:hypothetical protein
MLVHVVCTSNYIAWMCVGCISSSSSGTAVNISELEQDDDAGAMLLISTISLIIITIIIIITTYLYTWAFLGRTL